MKLKDKEKSLYIYGIILIIDGILSLIVWIAKFVLSLLLYHFIESADIEKYDDFLDWENIKENYFEKFKDINKLRKCFLFFAIFNIISECLDKAKELLEQFIKAKKYYRWGY